MRSKVKYIIIAIAILAIFVWPQASSAADTNTDLSKLPYCYNWTRDYYSASSLFTSSYKTDSGFMCYKTNAECNAAVKVDRDQVARLEWFRNATITQIEDCVYKGSATADDLTNTGVKTGTEIKNQACGFGVGTSFSLTECLKIGVAWGAAGILWILSMILMVAAQVFNASMRLSILDFHYLADSEGVKIIWRLGRDIANICFLFVLMYIAIRTIIQASGSGTKSMVVKVIITALLINFSILIPRVVIDVGNSLANVFYQNMGETKANGAPDIASTVVKYFKPQQFFEKELSLKGDSSVNTSSWTDVQKVDFSTIIIKNLGTAILILILSYALLVAAYMFLARTIVLIFLIATSSLAFFSRIMPGRLNYFGKWFDSLIDSVIFAPFFLFVFYLVLLLSNESITGINTVANSTSSGSASLANQLAATGATGSGSSVIDGSMQILWYVALCGMAIGSVIIAKKASGMTKTVSKNFREGIDKFGQYGGGWVAKNTLGRGASKIADSEVMKALSSAKLPFIGGLANIPGKYTRRGLMAAANAKFGGKTGFKDSQKKYTDLAKLDMEDMSDEQKKRYVDSISTTWAGKGKHTLQAERIKDLKDASMQYAAISEILNKDPKAGKKVLKELNDGTVAKLAMRDKNNNLMAKFLSEMDPEKRQKIDEIREKEEKREAANILSKERKAIIDQINSEVSGGVALTTMEGEAGKLNKGDINNLSKESLNRLAAKPDLLNKMKPEALVALFKNDNLEDKDSLLGRVDALANSPSASNSIKAVNKSIPSLIFGKD